jgi:hypothetical protein
MNDIAGMNFRSLSANQGLPANGLFMAEPELARWAEQKTVSGKADTPLVRIGAFLFWVLVAALLFARIFLVDAAKLRPAISATGATSSAFHLTSNAKL